MDLVQAARAFVHVADRGSFTRGAAAAGFSQSMASRRIASLESHLGVRLLDRAGRRPSLTPLGQRLLPAARRVVEAAESMVALAEEATSQPLRLAVPEHWGLLELAELRLAGRDAGFDLIPVPTAARHRRETVPQACTATLVTCRPDEGRWRVPLGLATAVPGSRVAHLDELRQGRLQSGTRAPVAWILAEDDVPQVRDVLESRAQAAGLSPTQVALAVSGPQAVADVLGSVDRLVLTAPEAAALGLAWAELEPPVHRGYRMEADVPGDASSLLRALEPVIVRLLGLTPATAGREG